MQRYAFGEGARETFKRPRSSSGTRTQSYRKSEYLGVFSGSFKSIYFILGRVSNVTGVSGARAVQPERWRDGERTNRLSQGSPTTKKAEVESKEEIQGNPNESLSDWEAEFLGKSISLDN